MATKRTLAAGQVGHPAHGLEAASGSSSYAAPASPACADPVEDPVNCKARIAEDKPDGRRLASSCARFIPALLLFGSNGIVASAIALNSMQIIFFRTLLGSLLMGSLVAVKHFAFDKLARSDRNRAIASSASAPNTATAQTPYLLAQAQTEKQAFKRSIPHVGFLLIIGSGIFMGISWMFQYAAYASIGVASTSLIYCLGQVLVVATSPIVFGEKIKARKMAAFALALIGIALVSTGYGEAKFDIVGMVFALMCALSYAGMIVLNKLASANEATALQGTTLSFVQLASGFAVTAICCAVTGNLPTYVPEGSIAPILALGLINTGLGCFLYFSSMGGIPAQSVAIIGYLEPMSSVIMAGIFLGESLSVQQLAGAALIACGVLGSELRVRERSTACSTARLR